MPVPTRRTGTPTIGSVVGADLLVQCPVRAVTFLVGLDEQGAPVVFAGLDDGANALEAFAGLARTNLVTGSEQITVHPTGIRICRLSDMLLDLFIVVISFDTNIAGDAFDDSRGTFEAGDSDREHRGDHLVMIQCGFVSRRLRGSEQLIAETVITTALPDQHAVE